MKFKPLEEIIFDSELTIGSVLLMRSQNDEEGVVLYPCLYGGIAVFSKGVDPEIRAVLAHETPNVIKTYNAYVEKRDRQLVKLGDNFSHRDGTTVFLFWTGVQYAVLASAYSIIHPQ